MIKVRSGVTEPDGLTSISIPTLQALPPRRSGHCTQSSGIRKRSGMCNGCPGLAVPVENHRTRPTYTDCPDVVTGSSGDSGEIGVRSATFIALRRVGTRLPHGKSFRVQRTPSQCRIVANVWLVKTPLASPTAQTSFAAVPETAVNFSVLKPPYPLPTARHSSHFRSSASPVALPRQCRRPRCR